MWPIQIIINELSLDVKTRKPIVCGMWFGNDKPKMNVFLKPYVKNMNLLSNEGIVTNIDNVEHRFYVYPVCCCVDSVARAPMAGMVQFNAYFGYQWCLHPGVYVRTIKGGSVKFVLLDEAAARRSEIDTLKHMQLSTRSRNPVFGVKNPSVLVELEAFNIINGFVPDSMHCLCLGITEQFPKYWVDTNNKPYSLSNDDMNHVDNIVLNVKAPNQIARLSQSMKERHWLKARELENWILYYSLPILLSFPHMIQYANHWALLVEAFLILNKKTISRPELDRANNLLKNLVLYTEINYSQVAMTFNIHQLLHIPQCG